MAYLDSIEDAFYSIFKNIFSILSGTAFSIIFLWIYGYILVRLNRGYLFKKAAFIENMGGLALPSTQTLNNLSSIFSFNCGAFVGLSLGLFLGIAISLIITIAKGWKKGLRAILFIIGIGLCVIVGNNFYPFVSLPVFIILPFIVYTGCSLPSLVMWKRRNKKAEKGWGIYFLSLIILIFSATIFSLYVKNKSIDYIQIRDNLLLTNRIGNYVNSFYYNHSPFAAETIKPLKGKSQFTILYIGDNKRIVKYFARYRKKMRLFLNMADDKEEIEKYLSKGGIDLIIIDDNNEKMYDYLFRTFDGIKNSSIFLLDSTNKKMTEKKYKNRGIVKPVNAKKIRKAIGLLSDLSNQAKGLRYLIRCALFDYAWISIITAAFLIILSITALSLYCLKLLFTTPFPRTAITLSCIIVLLTIYLPLKKLMSVENNKKNNITFPPSLYDLKDMDPRIRMYAAEAMGNLKFKKAVPELIRLLDDPQINVRYKSAEALGKIGDPVAVQPLLKLIKKNRAWYVSDYALRAVRKLK